MAMRKKRESYMDGKLRNMTSVYITYKDKILLLYRQGSRVVNHVWIASAGGHFENNELNDAKACVVRELGEELGIGEDALQYIKLRYITLRKINGEIRQNYYFFAELAANDVELVSNEGILKWFDFLETEMLEMPYTAKFVLEHYKRTGVHHDAIYGGIANETGVVFTELTEFV